MQEQNQVTKEVQTIENSLSSLYASRYQLSKRLEMLDKQIEEQQAILRGVGLGVGLVREQVDLDKQQDPEAPEISEQDVE